MRLNHRVEAVVMIDFPQMVGGGAAPRLAEAERPGVDMITLEPAAAPDDAPVEPASPEFDRGWKTTRDLWPPTRPLRWP